MAQELSIQMSQFNGTDFDKLYPKTKATNVSGLTANRALVSNSSGNPAVSAVTSTELGYLDGVTSSIQTQLNGKQATISGGASTITSSNLTASRALVSDSSGKVAASAITATELSYLDGVTSNIQDQLDAKTTNITGGASTIVSSNLTASKALISNSSGKVAVSTVTSTELGYLDGVTSAIQTQLNGKAASSHNHSASNITSGTLSIARGGTGHTSASSSLYEFINGSAALTSSTIAGTDYIGIGDVSDRAGKKITVDSLKYFLGLGNGALKIEYGTYIGTGTCLDDIPGPGAEKDPFVDPTLFDKYGNTLTFDFDPIIVIITKNNDGADGGIIFIRNQTMYANWGGNSSSGFDYSGKIRWAANSVSWVAWSTDEQFNTDPLEGEEPSDEHPWGRYCYIAIG